MAACEAGRPLKIFIPNTALDCETSLLFGIVDPGQSVCCITHNIPVASSAQADLQFLHPPNYSGSLQLLALWENHTLGHDPEQVSQCLHSLQSSQLPGWLHLSKTDAELPDCLTFGDWKVCSSLLIIFNAEDLQASKLLETQDQHSNLGLLYHGLKVGSLGLSSQEVRGRTLPTSLIHQPTSWVENCRTSLHGAVFKLNLYMATLFMQLCENRWTKLSWLKTVPQPAVCLHLYNRAKRSVTCASNAVTTQSTLSVLRQTDLVWRQLVDVLLGILVMYLLLDGDHTNLIADQMMQWAQNVASDLQQLLVWMMGVPAGLKLNEELARFLGQFFLYHIYLWKGYLMFIMPICTDAVWWVAVSGCLGITVQLTLAQDLLSMMTLHSYCFYVYAARLYYLQVSALVSLWRLFRGKKWNPLFQRVDSCAFDVDQLFMGTLLFTILLFLLPTTGLFYVVFTTLRLVVLSLQGTLYKLVEYLNSLPVYMLYLRFLQPKSVSADVRLHVIPRTENRPLYHYIQIVPVSLSKLFSLACLPTDHQEPQTYTWGAMLKKIISGQLLYPWIEPAKV